MASVRTSYAPLQDCTREAIQNQNVQHGSNKNTAKLTEERNGSFRHNPYAVNVIPTNPDELLQQMEERRVEKQRTDEARARARRSLDMMPPAAMAALGAQAWMMMMQLTYATHAASFYPQTFPEVPFFEEEEEEAPENPLPSIAAPVAASPVVATPIVLTKVYQNGRPVPRMKDACVKDVPTAVAPVLQLAPVSREIKEKLLPNGIHVLVKHRYHSQYYLVEDPLALRLPTEGQAVGTYVIVDGDRGIDIGQISAIAFEKPCEDDLIRNRQSEIVTVQRVATNEEIHRYECDFVQEEKKALNQAITQAGKLLNHRLDIEHVSFQFDKKKLTLWYRAPERVYFVPLLKALNQIYKCRIWMEKVDLDENFQQNDA